MTSMAIESSPSAVGAMIRRPHGEWEWRQTTALLHDFAEWIRAASGIDLRAEQDGFVHELTNLSAVYGRDGQEMFVAFDDGLAVGTIAVRYHRDRTAELKRMYVRSAARGRGIADLLAERAIAAAAEQGCGSIWLETLQGVMDPAINVYRRHGFAPSRRGGTLSIGRIVVMERRLDHTPGDEWS
jgi:GNAT superfamily N-acetyltransferase